MAKPVGIPLLPDSLTLSDDDLIVLSQYRAASLADVEAKATLSTLADYVQTHDLTTPVWSDYLSSFLTAKTGGSGVPSLAGFGPSGNIEQYAFDEGDYVYISYHINHDISVGSDIYPHIHWATDSTSTNTVRWQIDYIHAAGHDQAAFPADTTIYLEQAASATAWQHQITEVTSDAFTAPEVDSLLLMKVQRIANAGADNNDTVFGLFADLHVQIDTPGTLNKAPNFYT